MKFGRVILLLVIYSVCLFSFNLRPRFSAYEVKGRMFNTVTKKTISNSLFLVNSDSVFTDSLGFYECSIGYVSGLCRGGLTRLQIKKLEALINRTHIDFQYKGQKIFVKNKWKKYGLKNNNAKKPKVHKVSLKWF